MKTFVLQQKLVYKKPPPDLVTWMNVSVFTTREQAEVAMTTFLLQGGGFEYRIKEEASKFQQS